jgi:hypothetical protein
MISAIIDGTMKNVKIIIRIVKNLSILLYRARRAVLGTNIGTSETGSCTNVGSFYSNLVPELQ